MTQETTRMSRRSFLAAGTVAAVAGGAAVAGVQAAFADEAEEAAEETEETEEAAVGELQEADETMECDIVILGAGGAGIWAAVEACRAGKSVIVAEKGSSVAVSNGSKAGGPMIVQSTKQIEAGITDFTFDVAFKHVMDYAHWSTNGAAIRKVIEISGETIDQFEDDFGVPYALRPDNYNAGYDSIRARFRDDDGNSYSGEDRMGPLRDWTIENGAEYLFDATGRALIMEDGVCKGAQVVTDEAVININASAVIVATGGFLGNDDMMQEHFGTHVNPLGNELSTGEGIEMVRAVGGQLSTQWGIAGNEFCGSNQIASGAMYGYSNIASKMGIYGTLLVNNQGRRFSNEGMFANYPLALGGAISLLGGQYYCVVDQAYVDGLESGIDAWTLCGEDSENWYSGMMTLQGTSIEGIQADLEAAIEEGWAFSADTIEGLAEAIDAPDLVETLETYNGYCETGVDAEFLKAACFLQPVTTAPFYALQFEPSAWVTIGGVRTNDRMQAIDEKGLAIEGLYVAGADNGTLMFAPYTDYEGYSLMCAYCGGRLAGMYAAEDIDA